MGSGEISFGLPWPNQSLVSPMWRRDEELIIITVYLPILFLQDMAQAIVDEIRGYRKLPPIRPGPSPLGSGFDERPLMRPAF